MSVTQEKNVESRIKKKSFIMIETEIKDQQIISIVQTITTLVETVKKAKIFSTKSKTICDVEIQELQLLKTKCGDENPVISLTASHGIIKLVEDGIIPVGSTLSDLIVNLSTAKYCSGITMTIGNLLLLDMRRSLEKKKLYKCPFNLYKNQHPFITILSQNKDLSSEVLKQMQVFLKHFDDKISSNSLELLRPVFFFILCNPVNKQSEISRKNLMNSLITINNSNSLNLVFELLSWIKINNKQNCLDICDYLTTLSQTAIKNNLPNVCCSTVIYLSSLLVNIIKEGCDPTPYIRTILDILNLSVTDNTHSLILILLSENVMICPPVFLEEILYLCKFIIRKKYANVLSVKTLISTLIQWFLYPSCLLNESMKIAKEIITFVENNNEYGALTLYLHQNNYFKYVLLANSQIDFNFKLCLLAEKWQDNKQELCEWLDKLSRNKYVSTNLFHFISSIFINNFNNFIFRQKALSILTHIVTRNKGLALNLLILVLFTLHDEKDPEMQVLLLKTIPDTAVLRENMPLILTTLGTISNENNGLKSVALTLYLKLFLTEVRTFPYLQKLLLEPYTNYEFNVVKAQTLKEICIKKPDLHGKEMVGHLAQVLNKNSDRKGSLPSSLAIEGITALCEAGVIDIASTWISLSPKFSKDKRLLVINSLCNFFSGFSELRANSKENEMLLNNVINKLWHYVSYSSHKEIISSALKALSNFDVNEIALKQLPDLYRQNLMLPSIYAKISKETTQKPEDVLPYIPGECWVQMLQNINHNALEDAGNLLINWMHAEISEYESEVYIVADGRTEPINYNYLPAKSIVRGIGNALRLAAIDNIKIPLTTAVLVECLRILGQTFSKPLPPLNWCFLHDLFHKDMEVKLKCVNLACKQILLSGSALRFIENYISTFEPSIAKSNEILVLFSNLSFLCKAVGPNSLRPLITNSLQIAFEMAVHNKNDNSVFKQIIQEIKKALSVEDIQDANRILIGQIIEVFVEQIPGTFELFDFMAECIVECPTKYMEGISSPSLWWEITQDKFERAVKVRCLLAKRAEKTPFVWLNECINTATTLRNLQSYLLNNIVKVFEERRNHIDTADWILELLGQIQQYLTKDEKNIDHLNHLCDVFIIAVIVLSDHDCLVSPSEQYLISRETRLNLFPIALNELIRYSCQSISAQVMQWLYHMNTCSHVPNIYQVVFYQSLVLLRHEKAFIESVRWMKYMSLKYPS